MMMMMMMVMDDLTWAGCVRWLLLRLDRKLLPVPHFAKPAKPLSLVERMPFW